MTKTTFAAPGQRADYTYKHNAKHGRHGWLRLTPAYSVKVVEELLEGYPTTAKVLDPFCGTATTALSAGYRGQNAWTVEINPFLCWFAKAKINRYDDEELERCQTEAARILGLATCGGTNAAPFPAIHNINRWWDPAALDFLSHLKGEIDSGTQGHSSVKTLLDVAFCRTLIDLSNAAFNHQSISFKSTQSPSLFSSNKKSLLSLHESTFRRNLQLVLSSARLNPQVTATVLQGDSRRIGEVVTDKFDVVITSPPYPNRMSYIRELRPYMYWLGFIEKARDAGEMDWQAIGGTWGIATSRLVHWRESRREFLPEYLGRILDRITQEGNRNGKVLSNYVAKYFEDMWLHLESLGHVLSRKAQVHYIIGNSTFYGVVLPVQQVYADMFSSLGFTDIKIRTMRKRNSKKELYEYCVSATFRR